MSIYVEILIRAPMEALWAHSQTPELHERWDLRFGYRAGFDVEWRKIDGGVPSHILPRRQERRE